MNILFLLKSFEIGGVENVTVCHANYFVDHGHQVSIFAFRDAEHSIVDRLDKRVKTYVRRSLDAGKENVNALRAVLTGDRVQVTINQWGLPFALMRTARKAAKGLNVKFVSVYHNTPDMNGRLMSVDMQLHTCRNFIGRGWLRAKRCLFHWATAQGMRYNYRASDLYLVLSPSFVEKFKQFTGIRHPRKLQVQTNPVTIDCGGFRFDPSRKQKEIIYVGRIDLWQKRVERIIATWALLEPRFPDWRLTLVGDGPAREEVEQLAASCGLKRVAFEGFQDPKEYYRRASLLLLTSEFEGFGLVLVEAMSFGVIPVVYGSYSAVYDIIEDGKDGLILPYCSTGFPTATMAELLSSLLVDDKKRRVMAAAAMEKSKRYGIEIIYGEWMKKLERLVAL